VLSRGLVPIRRKIITNLKREVYLRPGEKTVVGFAAFSLPCEPEPTCFERRY
jgi:hypothetical protein